MTKNADAFRTISEVADDLNLPQHVLRFWETRFTQIKPLKRAGGRRFYRPADVQLLLTIRQLLYGEGYTIKGVQRLLKEQGLKALQNGLRPSDGDARDEPTGDAGAPFLPGSFEEASLPTVDHPPIAAAALPSAPEGRAPLVAALRVIVECERILRAARQSSP